MDKAKKLWLDNCRDSLIQAVGAAVCAGEHETATRINALLMDLDSACKMCYTSKNARKARENEEVKTMTIYGRAITSDDMATIADYMDDAIREELHAKLAPCTSEQFIAEYLKRDPDFVGLLRKEFDFAD